MATTITAGNATNGTAISSDNTGILELKTGTGSGTTAITLDASQNVGIGTSSPQQLLDVRGRIQVSNGTNGGQFGVNAGGLAISSIGAAPVSFYYNTFANESMRIDSSGNVGIGTNNPRAETHVFGLGQTTANLTDAGNRGGMLRVSDDNATGGAGGTILFSNSQGDAANSVGFAAIKGILVDGSNNTSGSLAFSTRTASTDTALTERMRIDTSGVITSTLGGMQVISGTAVTASGTSVSFTGIPSWVKRITVMMDGVSTNGTSLMLIQLGDAGGVETTGYVSASAVTTTNNSSTAGFLVDAGGPSAAITRRAIFTIVSLGSNAWVSSGLNGWSTPNVISSLGSKTLSDVLTQVRITTTNGTDAFDAGTINILYE